MRGRLVLLGVAAAVLAFPVGASAHPENAGNLFAFGIGGSAATALTHPNVDDGGARFETSDNMRLVSFLERTPRPAVNQFGEFASDLAFWGDTLYQGTWSGFRIIDIDDPDDPVELIDYRDCAHPAGQGDVVVWGSILVRTWDANTSAEGLTCDGQPVPAGPSGGPPGTGGFEGLHIFDVSDPGNPELRASVDLTCGSHTATGVPDLRNRRLLVYSTPSSGACDGIDIVEVPLLRPEESEFLRFEYAGKGAAGADGFACHDTGVILGRAMKAGCAGGVGFAIWSLGGKDGGSLDNPRFLYNHALPEIADRPENPDSVDNPTGHSAAFTWDGETFIFGHEPGGGVQPRCQEIGAPISGANGAGTQTADMKSLFFFDAESGAPTGKWTHERPQTAQENCTIHNYNLVPAKRGDILVHGSYQSGVSAVDMGDTGDAEEFAYADPAPLVPTQIGGDWSSYWYNGYIYESDITRGLYTWELDDRAVRRAFRLRHLNPQTQEFTIGARKDHDRWNDDDRWHDGDD